MARLYDASEIWKLLFPFVPGRYEKSAARLRELELWCEECQMPNLMCTHRPEEAAEDYSDV